MRQCLATFLVCAALVQAQRPEDAVAAVFRQMEKAEQTGDGQTWIDLWSAKVKADEHAPKKEMIRARPETRYQIVKILVDGDRAALVGTMQDQHLSVRFVQEGGAWKIQDQTWSNVPIDPASLYALVPPADGAFARAGSPWDRVQAAVPNTKYYQPAELRWKLQAVYDESYLYVRIDAGSVLPPPNMEVKGTFPDLKSGVARDWPAMKIRVAGAPPREYTFDASDMIGDQATFDESGKANSHRHYLVYSLYVRKGERTVFSASSGVRLDPLVTVHDRFLDLKFPLKALGVAVPANARIEILDANAPLTKFLPYEAAWMAP